MLTQNAKTRLIHLVARIAQSVEQRIENPRVRGSIPRPGTIQRIISFLATPFIFYISSAVNEPSVDTIISTFHFGRKLLESVRTHKGLIV